MKRKIENLCKIISIVIIIKVCLGIFSGKYFIFSDHRFHYKMYRLVFFDLLQSLTNSIFTTVLWVTGLYITILTYIFLIKKLANIFIYTILEIKIKDKNRLTRIIFSTAIALFFLVYDGWLINRLFISGRTLPIKIIVNVALPLITLLIWCLLVQGRWECFWNAILRKKNFYLKIATIIVVILVVLIFFSKMFLFFKIKINSLRGPNIILISIDTLRADHLGCYGYSKYGKNISPNIDKFSNEGLLFKNCIAQSPWTTPSHASMFTSLIPSHHWASIKERPILKSVITLGEFFRNNYYSVISYNGGAQVDEEYGFGRGFNLYNSSKKEAEHQYFDNVVKDIMQWVKSRNNNKGKFFWFLHSYEIHHPYTPHKEFLKQLETNYEGALPDNISIELLEKINSDEIKIDKNDREHIISTYDAEIMSVDNAFGLLVDFLKENNLFDNTLIIFTSDHGEEFNEHATMGWHGHSLYDELLHVPLIIKFPNSKYKGRVINEMVRSIDILPTLLDWVGFDKLDYFEGVSLMPLIEGKEFAEELFTVSQRYATEGFDGKERAGEMISSIRIEKWKWYDKKLFDLESDPLESKDVSRKYPKVTKFLENKLNEIINSNKLPKSKSEKEEKVKIDKQLEKQLKALGYL